MWFLDHSFLGNNISWVSWMRSVRSWVRSVRSLVRSWVRSWVWCYWVRWGNDFDDILSDVGMSWMRSVRSWMRSVRSWMGRRKNDDNSSTACLFSSSLRSLGDSPDVGQLNSGSADLCYDSFVGVDVSSSARLVHSSQPSSVSSVVSSIGVVSSGDSLAFPSLSLDGSSLPGPVFPFNYTGADCADPVSYPSNVCSLSVANNVIRSQLGPSSLESTPVMSEPLVG